MRTFQLGSVQAKVSVESWTFSLLGSLPGARGGDGGQASTSASAQPTTSPVVEFMPYPDPKGVLEDIASGRLTIHSGKQGQLTTARLSQQMNNIQRREFPPPYGRRGQWSPSAQAQLLVWLRAPPGRSGQQLALKDDTAAPLLALCDSKAESDSDGSSELGSSSGNSSDSSGASGSGNESGAKLGELEGTKAELSALAVCRV